MYNMTYFHRNVLVIIRNLDNVHLLLELNGRYPYNIWAVSPQTMVETLLKNFILQFQLITQNMDISKAN